MSTLTIPYRETCVNCEYFIDYPKPFCPHKQQVIKTPDKTNCREQKPRA